MACDHPLTALRLGIDESTGKQRIKIKRLHIGESLADFRKRYGAERVVLLPCGQCPSCQLTKRRDWSIRCVCEAEYHKENCFVTLTYDDDHCDGELHKEHFQQFIKNLRNLGYKVRYFACGEFGSKTNRPHMHAILFGFCPGDIEYSHDSDSGEMIFSSEIITSCWPYGLSVVQMFSPSAAGYVAGYTNKKVLDQRGFLMTSRRPGLGFHWFMDHKAEVMEYDKVHSLDGVYRPSRYFDKLADSSPDTMFQIVLNRDERIRKQDEAIAYDYFLHHHIRDESLFDRMREESNLKINKLKRGM